MGSCLKRLDTCEYNQSMVSGEQYNDTLEKGPGNCSVEETLSNVILSLIGAILSLD